MTKAKNKFLVLLINILISIILFFISAPAYNLRYFIDSIFYVTLTYFILLLFLFIIKGRFFDGITWSFRRFRSIMSKNRDYLVELGDTPMPSDRINIAFYRFIVFQTFSLLLILCLLLGVYYL